MHSKPDSARQQPLHTAQVQDGDESALLGARRWVKPRQKHAEGAQILLPPKSGETIKTHSSTRRALGRWEFSPRRKRAVAALSCYYSSRRIDAFYESKHGGSAAQLWPCAPPTGCRPQAASAGLLPGRAGPCRAGMAAATRGRRSRVHRLHDPSSVPVGCQQGRRPTGADASDMRRSSFGNSH